MYTQVRFSVPQERATFLIPQSALVVTGSGTQVATVLEDGKLHFQNVVVDTDYGSEVSLISGVTEKDRIVTNPGEKLVEGLAVRVSAPAAAEAAPAKK
jgi:multidrug efflux pump subunit AcrA (membrane-fusion protein)